MAINRYLRWMVEQTLDVSLRVRSDSRELPEYPRRSRRGSNDALDARRTATMTAAAPLAGTRVIDLGTRVAAPYCAAILGELVPT